MSQSSNLWVIGQIWSGYFPFTQMKCRNSFSNALDSRFRDFADMFWKFEVKHLWIDLCLKKSWCTASFKWRSVGEDNLRSQYFPSELAGPGLIQTHCFASIFHSIGFCRIEINSLFVEMAFKSKIFEMFYILSS